MNHGDGVGRGSGHGEGLGPLYWVGIPRDVTDHFPVAGLRVVRLIRNVIPWLRRQDQILTCTMHGASTVVMESSHGPGHW